MKKAIFIFSLALATNAHSQESPPDLSLTFHNMDSQSQTIWVNAQKVTLSPDVSLRLPCHEGEAYEVQTTDQVSIMSCGAAMEVE